MPIPCLHRRTEGGDLTKKVPGAFFREGKNRLRNKKQYSYEEGKKGDSRRSLTWGGGGYSRGRTSARGGKSELPFLRHRTKKTQPVLVEFALSPRPKGGEKAPLGVGGGILPAYSAPGGGRKYASGGISATTLALVPG